MDFNKYRQTIISILGTLLLFIVGAFLYQAFSAKKGSTISQEEVRAEIRNVQVESFAPSSTNAQISIDGRINAYEKISLGAEVTGRLLSTNRSFKKGDHFKKGALLFSIYDQDDQYNLFAQRANLLTSISQMMPDLKFDYPQSFEKWIAYLDQFDVQKAIKPLPDITDKNEKYYIAGRNIQSQYFAIKSLEDRLKNYKVYAPFNGTFLSLNAYPGTLVSPGSSLATIMNTAKFELEAPVATRDFQYVMRGQKVDLYSEEFDKKYKGTVSRVSTQIDQTTQNVPVFITVSGRGLKDGMYLRGALQGNKLTDVVEIPSSIIVDRSKVFVLQDSLLVKKTIEIVNRYEKTVIVNGINTADLVVVDGVNNLYEGLKAKALK